MTYVAYDGFDISPSLTIDTPAVDLTLDDLVHGGLDRVREGGAASTGMPSPTAHIIRTRSSGRGRLPVCVLRMRSVVHRLCLVVLIFLVVLRLMRFPERTVLYAQRRHVRVPGTIIDCNDETGG